MSTTLFEVIEAQVTPYMAMKLKVTLKEKGKNFFTDEYVAERVKKVLEILAADKDKKFMKMDIAVVVERCYAEVVADIKTVFVPTMVRDNFVFKNGKMIKCKQHEKDIRELLYLYTLQEKITMEEAADKLFIKKEDIEVTGQDTPLPDEPLHLTWYYKIKAKDLSIECKCVTEVEDVDDKYNCSTVSYAKSMSETMEDMVEDIKDEWIEENDYSNHTDRN